MDLPKPPLRKVGGTFNFGGKVMQPKGEYSLQAGGLGEDIHPNCSVRPGCLEPLSREATSDIRGEI